MAEDFRELLKKREIVIFDGAMGSILQEKDIPQGSPLEELNLTAPDRVAAVHISYAEAGVDVVETNTFGANRIKLKRYNLESKMEAINREGVRIAKEAVPSCLVGASIGPLGTLIEPWGNLSLDEASSAFKEQIEAVSKAGTDLIVIETMMYIKEAEVAVLAARDVCHLPVVCQITFAENGRTLMGEDPEAVLDVLEDLGVDALGANCSVGPDSLFPVAEKMFFKTHLPLIFQPNAGQPQLQNGKTTYPVLAELFSDWMQKFVNLGVKIVGGCCGTTPAHLKAIVSAHKSVDSNLADSS